MKGEERLKKERNEPNRYLASSFYLRIESVGNSNIKHLGISKDQRSYVHIFGKGAGYGCISAGGV